ncbi:MAG: ABC transporter permease [Anaerolineaceae bacterium]|nr:ABC transporter permease [Anaerolineaceae bacterium]
MTDKADIPVSYIRPARGWADFNFRDLWLYRELVFFLTWRDLKVRYKQTLLGASWAILQPFLTMVVFTIFFGNLAKVPSDGMPYPIFYYTALLPWQLFAKAMQDSSRSLVANRHMITKVYFPRMILPLSNILAGLVDFAIAFVVLLGMMVFYKVSLTSAIWTLPFLLLLALTTALGAGLWFSALNVLYRDVGYVIPFLSQFWMYLSPVVYPVSMLPERYQFLSYFNPMTGVIEGFRWAVLGTETTLTLPLLGLSTLVALLMLGSGIVYFRRMERTFADMV